MCDDLEAYGFVLRTNAIPEHALVRLLTACAPTTRTQPVRHPSGGTYGIRGLLWSSPSLRHELVASGVSALADAALGGSAFPVDAVFFDKQPDANWSVPGHRDRLMPIEPGSVAPKTTRNGIGYAEPPQAALAVLVALRVHFDDVGSEGGALEVVPGSHRLGLLSAEALRHVSLADYRPCVAARGDVLVMRPLLLHRSGRRTNAGHRRVLHVVYANEQPTDGLRWKGSA